jgi:hypothetical protein
MGISIDGFVAAPDGSQPWLGEPEDDAAKQWKLETVRGADAHLMGASHTRTWQPTGPGPTANTPRR